MPDPTSERPSAMKRRARKLLLDASAYASTLGDAQREEKERLLQEAQRLMDERDRMQKDLLRAVTHPATHHTPAASGAQEGETIEKETETKVFQEAQVQTLSTVCISLLPKYISQ